MGQDEALHHDAHRFGPAAPDEEYVYGSCAPGWHSVGAHSTCVEAWVEDMQAAGIERVCCLIAAAQSEASSANLGIYTEAFGEDRIKHEPVAQNRLVESDTLETEILPFLGEAVEQEEPVVVHCLSGLGRTGQVLAAWLVYDRGYRPERAVQTVRDAGRDPVAAVESGESSESDLFETLHEIRSEPEL